MSFSPDDFDPLGVITDWLDACRARETTALLDLYDDRATLECECEGVSLGQSARRPGTSRRKQHETAPAITLWLKNGPRGGGPFVL